MSYNRTSIFNNLVQESNNSLYVADEYRTNPLSRQPGGSTIQVKYSDGSIRIYDKIKNIAAYTRYLTNSSKNEILEVIPI
ncbi:hypothetical protein K8354_13140 [Polaribacter litorisediminis]|uniref:hypothetical protein n=1 Tax=Polaribacter litorisediminis TaxID=1908341 RepID=UPI001CBF261B|nr:hypothetical protein [Polaribacter litorisediminis]UAM97258.1 hypothetical protein K8354_13140 [Polaribacter litorisediminis]